MRAFAIRVDVTSGVSGFLRPGDRVDVYWTGSPPSGGGEFTKLIDTNVRLIAVDQSADEDRNDATIARTVTVEASPQQVATLAQAQQSGRLWLSLVGADDATVASAIQVDQQELLGIEAPQVVEVEQQQVCTVRTRRGGEIVEVPIECTN
jgi:pilus assembly protein CpaB